MRQGCKELSDRKLAALDVRREMREQREQRGELEQSSNYQHKNWIGAVDSRVVCQQFFQQETNTGLLDGTKGEKHRARTSEATIDQIKLNGGQLEEGKEKKRKEKRILKEGEIQELELGCTVGRE